MRNFIFFIASVFVFTLPLIGYAHQPKHSYIYLRVYENQNVEGRFELSVSDLNTYLGLQLKDTPEPDEVKPYLEQIQDYLYKNSSFKSKNGIYQIVFTDEISIMPVVKATYVRLHFYLEDSVELPDEIEVTYSVLFEEDPDHINMLAFEYNWKAGLINNESIVALDFTPGNETKILSMTDSSIWNGFVAMVKQGVWHIWIGLDHILFLLALILPSVVRRKKKLVEVGPGKTESKYYIWGWEPVQQFKPAFIYIIKVITFFTIAHTITLTLASLEIVSLPSRVVESIIALSIGLAAYHNITPIFKGKDWIIAFVFGLFHGFGFASVLGDLGIKGEFLTLTLFGFNLGVEIGQVAIIALIFPILYFVRKIKFYPHFLVYLSILLIIISLYWFVERAFDYDMVLDEKIRRFGGDILRALGLREDYYKS
ncbi:MAG: HupE/UreJ family protein [Arenibacter algicola]